MPSESWGLLPESSGWRPGLLLNLLQWTGQPCTKIHQHTNIQTYIRTGILTDTQQTHIETCTYTHVHRETCIHMHTRRHIYTHSHTYTQHAHRHKYIHMLTYTHTVLIMTAHKAQPLLFSSPRLTCSSRFQRWCL